MLGHLLALAGGVGLGAAIAWYAMRTRKERDSARTTRRVNSVLFEQVAGAVANAFYLYDFDEKRTTWFTRRFTDELGYSPEEVDSWDDEGARLIHPDDQPWVFGRWQDATDEPIEGEWRLRAADGTWRWVHGVDVAFSRRPDGSVRQVVGSVMDVTPMKTAQLELKKQRDELNLILVATTDLVFRQQPDGRLEWHGHVPGVDPGSVPATRADLLARVHPDDVPTVMGLRERINAGSPAFETEIRMQLYDDDYRWVRISGHSTPASDDRRETFFGAITDIHARRSAEEQVQQEHRLMEGITRTSVAAITVLDRAGKILFANESAERILGLTIKDLQTRTYDAPEWKHTDVDGGPWPDERQPFTIVVNTGQPGDGHPPRDRVAGWQSPHPVDQWRADSR